MPRAMPRLAQSFSNDSQRAAQFADSVESARRALGTTEAQALLPVSRIELAYELAYLRLFTAWEDFLEQSMLRYLCGFAAAHGQEQLTQGNYCTNLAHAKATLYGNQQYLLWHNPQKVVMRAASHFTNSRHETVIASIQGRVVHFSSIRHRIAHAHAEDNFNTATMALAGRRYRGARPGRFLRDWAHHSQIPMRWFEVISFEFRGLAFQIVPP